jgi:Mg/Co/Ni transporter MgtE
MTFAETQARRKALRYGADALMPGVNDAWDNARRARIDAELTTQEAVEAFNAALAHPVTRMEAACAMAELMGDHIGWLIDEAGEEYVGSLLSRLDAATKRIRAHLLKDEP